MKKISLKDIKDGDILARDVKTADNKLLFKKGIQINRLIIAKLKARKIDVIFVKSKDIAAEFEFLDNETIRKLENKVDDRFKHSKDSPVSQETFRVAKKLVIERALKKGEILSKTQLNLIYQLKDMPKVPSLFTKLSKAVNGSRATVKSLSSSISADKIHTSTFLKLANSIFFKFDQKILNLERALNLIGFENSLNLLLSLMTVGLFKPQNKRTEHEINCIWGHSLGTGIIARAIAQKLKMKNDIDLFYIGMFHDIGRIIMAIFLENDYYSIAELKKGDIVDTITLESDILGYSHGDVGRLFVEKWGLSGLLKSTVTNHHFPELEEHFPKEVAIINIANVMSHSIQFGGGDENVPGIDETAWVKTGLRIESIEPILNDAAEIYDEISPIILKSKYLNRIRNSNLKPKR